MELLNGTNMCVTTSSANGITPYQMWYSRSPPLNLLQPFGTVGYLRRMKREHKLAPRGETCLMICIPQSHPKRIFRVLNVNTGEILIHQSVSWHPETLKVQGDGDQTAVSGGGSSTGEQMPQPCPKVNMEVTTALPPTTQHPERTVELAEGPLELGVGDESESGHELGSKGGDPKQQTESGEHPQQQNAALRKLKNTWTGSPRTVLSSRTRSGGGATITDGHEAALNVVLASEDELEQETVAHESVTNLSAMKATLVKPGGQGNNLPPEPPSRRQAMESPDWECWEAGEKTEMSGLISKRVWT